MDIKQEYYSKKNIYKLTEKIAKIYKVSDSEDAKKQCENLIKIIGKSLLKQYEFSFCDAQQLIKINNEVLAKCIKYYKGDNIHVNKKNKNKDENKLFGIETREKDETVSNNFKKLLKERSYGEKQQEKQITNGKIWGIKTRENNGGVSKEFEKMLYKRSIKNPTIEENDECIEEDNIFSWKNNKQMEENALSREDMMIQLKNMQSIRENDNEIKSYQNNQNTQSKPLFGIEFNDLKKMSSNDLDKYIKRNVNYNISCPKGQDMCDYLFEFDQKYEFIKSINIQNCEYNTLYDIDSTNNKLIIIFNNKQYEIELIDNKYTLDEIVYQLNQELEDINIKISNLNNKYIIENQNGNNFILCKSSILQLMGFDFKEEKNNKFIGNSIDKSVYIYFVNISSNPIIKINNDDIEILQKMENITNLDSIIVNIRNNKGEFIKYNNHKINIKLIC